jgi:hypothetical protein
MKAMPFEGRGVPARPVEPQCASPVVDDERDALEGSDLLEEGIQVAAVVDEAVALVWSRIGVAHPDQVGRDAAAERLQVRDDVAPQVGLGRVAVQDASAVRSWLVVPMSTLIYCNRMQEPSFSR